MIRHKAMGHSFINVNVHVIFHTKQHSCTIKEEHLHRVFQYIAGAVRAISGHVYAVGGRPDHIHILSTLPTTTCLSDFVRNIKANSSKWIKSVDTEYKDFAWQEGYGAFSVSESGKKSVIGYITNQKIHHRKYTAQEEFQLFLEKHRMRTDETDANS